MKKILVISILSLFLNLVHSQGTDILSSEQFCSGTTQLTFNNVFGMPNATPVGCLGSIPNASYFFLEIDQPGDLIFSIDQENLAGTPIDVDFIAWGPFTDLNDANTNISYTDCPTCPNNTADPTFYPYAPDFITDCSFSFQSFETMNILNANQGEIYVVLITNYNGAEGIINFQQTGGTGTTTCASLPVCGSQYFDSGGSTGVYSGNESTTIYPYFTGGTVTVDFTAVDIPDAGDVLTVYNGPNNTFPVLGTVTATGSFTSNTTGNPTGAITFEFVDDGDANFGSGWEADITCTAPPTPPTCGSTFYDSGGAGGDYGPSEFQTYTFYPDTAGDVVTATFLSFDLESCCDDLTVYDGPNTTYPLLGTFSGTGLPGPFTSTDPSGALTFVFDSDSSVQYSGWEALLTCSTPLCGTTIYDSGGLSSDYGNNESVTTTYYPDTAGDVVTATFTAFDTENGTDILTIYDGPDATYPSLGSFSGNTIPGPFTSTDATGALTFVFTSNGSITGNGWAADITCTTITCGSFFYDSGGSGSDYFPNELQTTTFFPDNAGDTVTVTFTLFDLESCCDDLSVYDGPDATYPLLGTYTGTTLPGPFTSTDPSGALTFVFDSDGSVQYDGWAAEVTCASICNLIITDTVYPLGADDCTLDYTELATNATGSSGNVTVYSESFDTGAFPTGWVIVNGAASADWIISNTSEAGGTPNEAMLDWTSGSHNNTWSLTSPLIDITGETNLALSFRQNLDLFGSNLSIYVETSLNGTTWTTQYSAINPTADIFSSENIDLSALDGNTTLYLRFRLTGDTFSLFDWSIDDIEITADGVPTPPQVTWSPIAGLYTDITLSTPYTGGFAGTVYAAPDGTETYTATDALSCTDMVTVTHNKKLWNGSDPTDGTNWYIADNWTPSGVPTSSNCITIPDPTLSNNNSPVADVSYLLGIPLPPFPAFGRNLTVDANGFLEIKSDTFLDISEWVNIDPNGTLVIRDSGSLIQDPTATTNTNTGTVSVQRSVSNLNNYDYVYWSSPVSGFDVEQISPITPSGFIYKWLPTQPASGGIGNHGDWYYPNPNEIMELGTGYIVRDLGGATLIPDTPALPTTTAEFRGVANNGTVTVAITRGTHLNAAGNYTGDNGVVNGTTPQDDNWNLIGNPYPSAISYTDFINANTEIDGTIYLWTHQNAPSAIASPFYENFLYNYSDDYIDNNYTGSNPPGFNGNIASGQAFFVLMEDSGSTTESVTFTNAMRNAGNDNSQFYRQEESETDESDTEIERHRIWLDLIDSNDQAKSILIGYIEGATLAKDRLYDGYNFGSEGINFYSLIGNSKMSIQGRPIPFDDTDLVPLGINLPTSGTYTIAINTIDGIFENSTQNIFLEDVYSNVIHDIRAIPYTFTSESGTFNDRFILRYTNETLSTNTVDDIYDIIINAPDSEYISIYSQTGILKSVDVYDIIGRLILNVNNVNDQHLTLEDTNFSAGSYIVKVELVDGKQKVQKIILKH